MSLTVADLWAAGLLPPRNVEPPRNGSPRFRALVRRQVESLDWLRVPLRFWLLATSPRRRHVALTREWPRLRHLLDSGRLVPLGLVREPGPNPLKLTRNHQVLAYGFMLDAAADRLTIRVYDPNWPDADDVTLVVDGVSDPARASFAQSTGEPLLAFFVAPWSPRPARAWR